MLAFQHLLPLKKLAEIASSKVFKNGDVADSPSWGFSNDGMFSVKSACEFLESSDIPRSNICSLVWKLRTKQRIRTFMWLTFHNKLLTNEGRFQRHLTQDPSCPRCSCNNESILHMLRDCPSSRSIWTILLPTSRINKFFSSNFIDWLHENLSMKSCSHDQKAPWASIFATACWKIWSWRCKKVFENLTLPPTRAALWIRQHAYDDEAAWSAFHSLQHPGKSRVTKSLSWNLPPIGVVKLNVDGSAKGNPGAISSGGVARDCRGQWLFGFSANLGFGSITTAELWGVFYGLSEALRRNITHAIISCDSKVVVHFLGCSLPDSHPHSVLIASCQRLMSEFHSCDVKHDFREMNKVADNLANIGHSLPFGLKSFDHPPNAIAHLLLFDLVGGVSYRNIAE